MACCHRHMSINENFGIQRETLASINRRITGAAAQIPGVNGLIQRIGSKRRRDGIILGSFIAFLLPGVPLLLLIAGDLNATRRVIALSQPVETGSQIITTVRTNRKPCGSRLPQANDSTYHPDRLSKGTARFLTQCAERLSKDQHSRYGSSLNRRLPQQGRTGVPVPRLCCLPSPPNSRKIPRKAAIALILRF